MARYIHRLESEGKQRQQKRNKANTMAPLTFVDMSHKNGTQNTQQNTETSEIHCVYARLSLIHTVCPSLRSSSLLHQIAIYYTKVLGRKLCPCATPTAMAHSQRLF